MAIQLDSSPQEDEVRALHFVHLENLHRMRGAAI